jgi:membrane dipeptidase
MPPRKPRYRTYLAHDHMQRAEDFARDRAGGVTGKILHLTIDGWIDAPSRQQYEAAYYGYEGFLQRGLEAATKVLRIADDPANKVRIVRVRGDLGAAHRASELALILGNEGGKIIEESLGVLEAWHRLGLRHIQLNWAMRNQIAASQSNEDEKERPGLTPFGFQAIGRMNDLGMVVDVSHSSPQTIKDVLRTTKKPILNSHSGSRLLANKQQNLWDEQLRDMATNGGVVGIHFCSRLVLGVNDKQATIPDVIRQVKYCVDKAGIDTVGLGPDWVLGDPERDRPYVRNTNQVDISWTKGLESSAEMGNLLPALEEAGFKEPEIEKILGGNMLRLFNAVLPV